MEAYLCFTAVAEKGVRNIQNLCPCCQNHLSQMILKCLTIHLLTSGKIAEKKKDNFWFIFIGFYLNESWWMVLLQDEIGLILK